MLTHRRQRAREVVSTRTARHTSEGTMPRAGSAGQPGGVSHTDHAHGAPDAPAVAGAIVADASTATR